MIRIRIRVRLLLIIIIGRRIIICLRRICSSRTMCIRVIIYYYVHSEYSSVSSYVSYSYYSYCYS